MFAPDLANFAEVPQPPAIRRNLPVGAECQGGGIHFRLWSPAARRVAIALHGKSNQQLDLKPEGDGHFSLWVPKTPPGTLYSFRLNGRLQLLPDPVSRFQPQGPAGPSEAIDPKRYAWRDAAWPGLSSRGQVLYEMHVGTFTREGNWQAAAAQLPELARLGITAVELLPVADFPGRFGWGYDSANLFAPSRLYGTPDDFRAFVDQAHRVGIGVLLDVVYNHLGTVGESLVRPFADEYFSTRHTTEWGAALNFDGDRCEAVRTFVLANVAYWVREFHLDGFRVDATQALHDDSDPHILREITRVARDAAGSRSIWIIAENEPQRATLLRSAATGGFEFDALWNDDFHHAAMVRLTGRNEAYLTDYRGSSHEFVASAEWGFLFQGQRYHWQNNPRGTPALDIAPHRFINYLQNHDQLANSAHGARVHQLTSPGRYRAMTALLLLGPQIPLLFQGQEFGASTPFLYFNDCDAREQDQVRQGRAKFLAQFRSLATTQMQQRLVDPCDPANFERCRLDHMERERHGSVYALHSDLLRLRREDRVFAFPAGAQVRGGTIGPDAFFLRYFHPSGDTRLLIVNFDLDLWRPSIPHPLVAPPAEMTWDLLWSSEDPRYGGGGTAELETAEGWHIPGESAVVLVPNPRSQSE